MARENMDRVDVYLLAAIAVFSLLLIAVELIPIPTSAVIEEEPAPKFIPQTRGGAMALVRIPPTPATTMAIVEVA